MALLALWAGVPCQAAPDPGRRSTLVLGRVSDEAAREYPQLKAFADYVVGRLGGVGITRAEVRVVPSVGEAQASLRDGRMDWLSETAFSAETLMRAGVADVILRRWKGGAAEYRTLFITQNSSVQTLSDLVGRRIAFEDAGSTTGYFVPRRLLEQAGLSLVELQSPGDPVPPGKVGYVFARHELTIAAWLARGLVDAGVCDNLRWNDPTSIPVTLRTRSRVFKESESFPRAVELVRRDLDPAVRERLRAVLLAAGTDPSARPVLDGYFNTTRFDELPEGAFHGVRRLLAGERR